MAIINSDPWEETNSSRDLTQATETKHRDRRLFRFQDLASDYYQVSEAVLDRDPVIIPFPVKIGPFFDSRSR